VQCVSLLPGHSASAPIMPLYLMDGINHPRQGPPVCPSSPTVNVWYGHGWRYIANAGGRRHPPPLLIPSTLCTSSWPRRPAFVHDWTGHHSTAFPNAGFPLDSRIGM